MTALQEVCYACFEGRHHDCNGSVRCKCDCDGEAISYGYEHDPDLDETSHCRICGKYEPE